MNVNKLTWTMKNKNLSNSRIYNKRGLYFSLGLIISLLLVISAFEWKTYNDTIVNLGEVEAMDETLFEIPQTEILPPKPKKLINPTVIESDPKEIEVVLDDYVIDFENEVVIDSEYVDPLPLPEEEIDEPLVIAEKMPEPVGGYEGFYTYLYKEIRYPSLARRGEVSGKVYLSFIVDKDGSLSEIKVIRGIGAGCDEEAIRALRMAPKWTPGKQRGKPVRVKMVLPITFRLK